MRKVVMSLAVFGLLIDASAESKLSVDEVVKNTKKDKKKTNRSQSALDKLKMEERKRLQKSQVKLLANPYAQDLLSNFLNELISKSDAKMDKMIEKRIDAIDAKARKIYYDQIKQINLDFETKSKEYENINAKKFNNLKETLKNELNLMEENKENLVLKQKEINDKILKLEGIFNKIGEKMTEYTKYIDSKFSLKGVKETELSRIFLLKETFPIKYVKNFNNKRSISIVLNNNKEYKIHSMLTERCRIADLSRSHIKIQCIDIKNKLYENIMTLQITKPEHDYILKSIDKKIKEGNKNYSKKELIEAGISSKDENMKLLENGDKTLDIDKILDIQ